MRSKVYLFIGMLVMGFVFLSNVGSTYALDSTASSSPSVSYASHVEDIGWQAPVADGAVSGTEGQSKRMEAIQISVKNVQGLGVKYSTHVQDYGWQAPVADGQLSGTTGQAKRIEAIKLELTGSQAGNFDIYYRVNAESYGWMNWAKNGEIAGTTGESKRLEAIEIIILPKGTTPPPNNATSEIVWPTPSVTYSTHVQDYGWLAPVADGALSGKDAEGKRIEAVQISIKDARYAGGITYKTHVQDYGWLNNVSNGATSGTTGQSKRAEAIQMNLTGDMANHYDVYYRVHAQDFGWLDWAKDGQSAGTTGLSKQLVGLEIVIVAKGGAAPGPTNKPFMKSPSVVYSSHVQDIGWQGFVADGALSGTQGQGKRLEATKMNLQDSPYSGDITYSTYVQDTGWGNSQSNGGISGTVGQGKRLEAIKIGLTGDIANYYDVYYRVHSQTFGWLGWTKNGEPAGTEGLALRIEAMEVVLVTKGGAAPGSTDKPYITKPSVVYSSNVQDIGWQTSVLDGGTSGTVGQSKQIEAIKISLKDAPFNGDIIYSSQVQDYGWLNPVSNDSVSGTAGKRMEAININLTGDMANYFDVYYRVHSQDYGWLGWAKDGMNAGTQGLAKRMEAIEIKLVPKGLGDTVNADDAFKKPNPNPTPAKTIFIDPGHGGTDPGATYGSYRESDLNLAVGKKVQALLLERGYNVIMSRTTDTFVPLLDRSIMANNDKADIFVSIHTNSSDYASVNGIESYFYQLDPTHPSTINAAMATDPDRLAKSVTLASIIDQKMVAYTGAADRGSKGSDLSVVRESAMPATLVEMGFIGNATERQNLFTDSYQNSLAKAIADGIDEYFQIY
jgi:uncharacterized protein YjdB